MSSFFLLQGKTAYIENMKENNLLFYIINYLFLLITNANTVAIAIAKVKAEVRGNSGMSGISAGVGVVISKGERVGVGDGES